MSKKKFSLEQKKKLWEMGNWDSYSMEVLQETAYDNIEVQFPDWTAEQINDAVPIYVDGFCGTNKPRKGKSK